MSAPPLSRLLPTLLAAGVVAGCTSAPATVEFAFEPRVEVATFAPDGTPTRGVALADEIYGLGENAPRAVAWDRVRASLEQSAPREAAFLRTAADQDPQQPGTPDPAAAPTGPAAGGQDPGATQDPAATQDPEGEARRIQDERRREEARLRIAFGDAILINADGTITKQYFLGRDAGGVFLGLLAPLGGQPAPPAPGTRVGGAETQSVLGRMLGPDHEVEVIFVNNFEQFQDMPPRVNPKAQARPAGDVTTSLLLVTARPDGLSAFEKALDLFYANIPQVQIEVKVVEYTVSDTVSFGIEPIDGNTPVLRNLSSGRLIQQITSSFPLSAPLSGTGGITDRGLISLGGIHDTWELNAILEALETRSVADILTQPTMVVRNGGQATVSTVTAQPFPKGKITNQTVTTTDIDFKDVGVVMDIRPEVAGTETVVLNIYVSVSAISGFAATEPVPTPIIVSREAATSVHLREGESTVIGGLVQEIQLDSESKLPILGDIPILGYLFRSTSTQEQRTMLEFYITPRILRGPRGMRPGSGF
ncbi:MAG: type II and III secretion system protein [Planctomycetes bacterium]|nr:type II and III secretion system protein [Planctomycetota bacterium]